MTRPQQSVLIRALAACAAIPVAEIGATVAKRLNRCLSIIRESTPEVTLEEMRARYRMHRKTWPGITVTPESLAKHWPELSSTPREAHSVDSGGICEPEGWRNHALTLMTDIEPETATYLAGIPWRNIPVHLQRVIAARHMPHENVVPFKITA